MKLLIVITICLLSCSARGEEAERSDAASDAKNDDFLLGLVHHAVHGTLNVAHHAVGLVGHVLIGDEEVPTPTEAEDEQEKKDFLLGLIHHAVRGVVNVAHHAVNFVGHVLGDQVPAEDMAAIRGAIERADTQEEKDFLIALLHTYKSLPRTGPLFGDVDVDEINQLDNELTPTEDDRKQDFLIALYHAHKNLPHSGPLFGDVDVDEINQLDNELAKLTPTEDDRKQDFLLGLIHHAVRGVLNVAHHAVSFVGHVLGDEDEEAKLDEILKMNPDFELVRVEGATEQEKKDFIFGLLHHAIKGVLGVAHGIVHLAGHILGDDKLAPMAPRADIPSWIQKDEQSDIDAINAAIARTDDPAEKDFLLGLIRHAAAGVIGTAHRAVNLVGHVLIGDEEKPVSKEDFLLGLAAHAIHGTLGAAHGLINLVGHIAGDKNLVVEPLPKEDFLLGLAAHAIAGTLGVAHHAIGFVGHVLGDENLPKLDNQKAKEDFLLGLAAHAIHGTLGAAHGAVNLVGHVLIGDEEINAPAELQDEPESKDDFLLGLAAHAIHGTLGAAHGAVNLVGHVLIGDENVPTEDATPELTE